MKSLYASFVFVAGLGSLLIGIQPALAQGTAFTYQGQLNNSSGPATGSYDFTFGLFDNNATNSGQVGSTQTLPGVGVTNGLFTVTLDFGASFSGASRWLAIGVRTNGGGSYTALSPLQSVTPTPYAVYAPNAGMAASANSVAGSNIVGPVGLTQLPAGVLTNGGSGVQLSGSFTGDGSQLTSVTIPGLITQGILPLGVTNYSSNGTYLVTVPPFVNRMLVKLWGAGGGSANSTDGGGGAFSQVTLSVNPGETFVVVVGQAGDKGGGAGSNDGSGGAGMTANGDPTTFGGTGGQASSLFKLSGPAYIMKAVAGGGGGGGGNTFGGNAGQAAGTGIGYGVNATTIGYTNLNLMGGAGAAADAGTGPANGGNGGGYGGGVSLPNGQANGGDSYGDITLGGSLNIPANTGDSNYVGGAARGADFPAGHAGDGLAVVLFGQQTLGANFSAPVETSVLMIGTSNKIAPLTVLPTIPTSAIGSNSFTGVLSLAVAGRYAYALGSGILVIYDVSNPSAPTPVGNVTFTGGLFGSIAVAGRYAYVTGNNALLVFDVSNPANPASVGSTNTGVNPASVVVAGRYAYVANNGANTLQIFDVSKPSAPSSVGSIATATSPNAVAVSGRYAYVGCGTINGGVVQVFDVSAPATPTLAGATSVYDVGGVAVSGRYAYAGGNNAFAVIDVANPASPQVVGSLSPGFFAYPLAVADRYVFLGVGNNNLVDVIDVSTPSTPAILGSFSMAGPGTLAVSGRYVYVGNATGLQIFDLGGAYVQQLETGAIETGTLQTRDTLTVGSQLNVRGSVAAGGNALVTGGLSVSGVGVGSGFAIFGNGTVGGVGAYVNASDARYKTNINALTHALDKIMALRGVEYDWRTNAYPQMNFDNGRQLGFVAQEIKDVLPEVVTQDASGYYSIAYSKVIPVLVEAVKDQQKEMDRRQQAAEMEMKEKNREIQDLKQSLAELKQQVQALAEKK